MKPLDGFNVFLGRSSTKKLVLSFTVMIGHPTVDDDRISWVFPAHSSRPYTRASRFPFLLHVLVQLVFPQWVTLSPTPLVHLHIFMFAKVFGVLACP